jgi:PAB-dependent poly(A)-specific ribonuclease subunit 2
MIDSLTELQSHPIGDKDSARPLNSATERPTAGSIIALDTEFVAVRQPEIEVNSDGERETIRPIVYALARVSVVRGQGEDEGVPFIDDYIAVKEPIVDYLTSYSGITRADLDPRLTKRNLVSLKTAYKKIWILLNSGCRILGHGLKQDFRVINIHVPRAQVIDTIDFFYLKSRLRKLSLAFLAWCLLKEDIQLETHDSIEDARTALKLYRKFLEFQDAGILEAMLQDIYRRGREVNFKPPRKDGGGADASGLETPPLQEGAGAAPPVTPSKTSAVGFGSLSRWTPGKGAPGLGSPLR